VPERLPRAFGVLPTRQLFAGERDPRVLAERSKGKLRAKRPQLAEAMAGRVESHHAVVARSILDHLDFLDHTIDALTAQIVARTRSFAEQVELLAEVPGLDRATIQVILAETGGDMSRFPTLRSWLPGLVSAPAIMSPAGKRRNVATPPGNRWLRRALIEAARAAARTRGSYFAARERQIARRRGPDKAAVAVAHSLVIVMMLAAGEPFHALGEDWFQRRRDPERESRRLVHQLERLATPSRSKLLNLPPSATTIRGCMAERCPARCRALNAGSAGDAFHPSSSIGGSARSRSTGEVARWSPMRRSSS
jgi:transposase